MRHMILPVMAAFILTAAVPAYPLMKGGEAVSIEIVSEREGAFLSIPYKDSWKSGTRIIREYLEARRGENYGIVIRNMTPERVGVVIAVDGRNIISGKKSDLKNTEAMYVVSGYGYTRYEGWRTDDNTVHKFYFTDTADSYSVRTFGDSSAMGVIAVAVYREKEQPRPLFEGLQQESASPAPSVGALAENRAKASRDRSAGTGFGDEKYSPVRMVAFEPGDTPVQKTLVKYEWHEVLCRKGLLSCTQEGRNRLWDGDYAPYPPGYRGW